MSTRNPDPRKARSADELLAELESRQPSVGSVWGDPARPETWRHVRTVKHRMSPDFIWWHSFETGSACKLQTQSEWLMWVNDSGAVCITDLLGPPPLERFDSVEEAAKAMEQQP